MANDTKVANDQMTASSHYGYVSVPGLYLPPWKGRLNHDEYWATSVSNPSDPWIKVDFRKNISVKGIAIQGSGGDNNNDWIKTLEIQYGNSQDALVYIMEAGYPKESIKIL